jgi:hypothetical protein
MGVGEGLDARRDCSSRVLDDRVANRALGDETFELNARGKGFSCERRAREET